MSDAFLRIAVTGVTGRMGKEVIKSIIFSTGVEKFNKKVILGAAVARSNSSICGTDIGMLIKSHTLGIMVTDNLESVRDDFDVLIDFTVPDISVEYLKFCVNNRKNMIIGTTGFNKIHKELIQNASKKIGIVYSPNFSIGIALISKLLRNVTKIIGNSSDISIVETHHNKKRDAPSGTSLMMKEIIANSLRDNCFDDSINDNIDFIKTDVSSMHLSYSDLPIYSIRAGDIIGEHTVLFARLGERIDITHKVSNRIVFAHGALCSAIWLGPKKIGLFDISDILEINA